MKLIYILLIFPVLVNTFNTHLLQKCNVHPSHWCSSEKTARQCEVYEQCSKYVWQQEKASQQDDNLVDLAVYYESLCPDSINFIVKQLYPVMTEIGNIIKLSLIPYGNAHEKQAGSKWIFECQHGPEECLGNVIETCTIHFYPDVTQHFHFVHCMALSKEKPETAAPKCALSYEINYNTVGMCANSTLGNMLEHRMALITDDLDPPHKYVPWVTLNGNILRICKRKPNLIC